MGAGLVGAFTALGRGRGPPADEVLVLIALVLGGLATVWVVDEAAAQGRLALVGLPALACLVALGHERLRWPLPARLALPALTLAGSIAAIHADVIGIYS